MEYLTCSGGRGPPVLRLNVCVTSKGSNSLLLSSLGTDRRHWLAGSCSLPLPAALQHRAGKAFAASNLCSWMFSWHGGSVKEIYWGVGGSQYCFHLPLSVEQLGNCYKHRHPCSLCCRIPSVRRDSHFLYSLMCSGRRRWAQVGTEGKKSCTHALQISSQPQNQA